MWRQVSNLAAGRGRAPGIKSENGAGVPSLLGQRLRVFGARSRASAKLFVPQWAENR